MAQKTLLQWSLCTFEEELMNGSAHDAVGLSAFFSCWLLSNNLLSTTRVIAYAIMYNKTLSFPFLYFVLLHATGCVHLASEHDSLICPFASLVRFLCDLNVCLVSKLFCHNINIFAERHRCALCLFYSQKGRIDIILRTRMVGRATLVLLI